MDNLFPQNSTPRAVQPPSAETSAGSPPLVDQSSDADKAEPTLSPTLPTVRQDDGVATPRSEAQRNGERIISSASEEQYLKEQPGCSPPAKPSAADFCGSSTAEPNSDVGGTAAITGQGNATPYPAFLPDEAKRMDEINATSYPNLDTDVRSGVATNGQQNNESEKAVLSAIQRSHPVVRPMVMDDPLIIQNAYPEDSPAEIERIAKRILARRQASVPQQQVMANASRIRGLQSHRLNVKEIYCDLVLDGRINADKVSYKQFADQVKKLPE